MSDFKSTLGLFLTGDVDLDGLERSLVTELASKPDAGPDVLVLLEQLYQSGRLPHQIYAVLKRIVVSGGPDGSSAADRTGTESAGPGVQDDDDRTRFRLPADRSQARTGDDRTRIGVTGRSRRTGQRPHQVSQPSQTSGTSQSMRYPTAGTGAGSTWGHPSQWDGGGGGDQSSAVLDVGSIVKSRYVLEKKVGEGGMGVVYMARDLMREEAQDRNPHVALKLLNEEFKRHPDSLKALQREARKAQDLAHPNIVNVFDFDRDGANVFMTMEYLEGEPLDRLIRRHRLHGLEKERALEIIEEISAGLIYAHKKRIVHSDLKPGNVYITKEGVAKVFDFGIARAAKIQGDDSSDKTRFDAGTLGALTPAYASLEMLAGDEPRLRDDVYALACIAYELLTGRHPFEKLSADKARLKGMKPERVKKIGRSQFRALCKGLEFERERRSANVQEFIDGLQPVSISTPILIGGAAVAVLSIVLLSTLVPAFLDGLRVDQLAEVVNEGSDDAIESSLDEIAALVGSDVYRDLFADGATQDRFIEFFDRRIRGAFDPDADRYDYVQADGILRNLEQLEIFKGRGSVEDIRERIDEQRADAIANVRAKLNQYREEGRLIALQGESNVVDTLETIRLLDPDDPALSDKGIPIRFAQVAKQGIEAGDFALARPIVEQGIALLEQGRLVADDESRTALINLRDRVASEEERSARAGRLSELEASLSTELARLNDLAAFDASVRGQVQELATLEPSSKALREVRNKLIALLAKEVETYLDMRDFDRAQALVDTYQLQLQRKQIDGIQKSVVDAREQQRARIDGLLADLLRAIDAGNLAGPARSSAEGVLTTLENAGADQPLLTEARQSIAEGYRQKAAESRVSGDWDQARAHLERGIAQRPGDIIESLLRSDLDAIEGDRLISQANETAEVARLQQQQRQREVETLRAAFEGGLAKSSFNVASARTLLDTLQQLEAKGSPILNGEQKVMDRLFEQIGQLRREGALSAALDLADQAGAAFPDSTALRSSAISLREEVAARGDAEREGALAAALQRIEILLSEPALDQRWNGEAQKAVQSLEAQLPSNDTRVAQARERIALVYTADATSLRAEKRLDQARVQLDRAESFAPGLEQVRLERRALQQELVALEKEIRRKEGEAALERSKQNLLAEANRGDVDKAIEILGKLAKTLPESDPFVSAEAPAAIAAAYVALARKAMSGERYDNADALIGKALEFAPDFRAASDLRAELQPLKASSVPESPPPQPVVVSPPVPAVAADVKAGLDACANSGLIGRGARRGTSCRDELPGGRRGPSLIVIPAGGPFSSPVAITKYEVMVRNYNAYCEITGACKPAAGNDTLPLTGVSVREAEAYAAWLTDQTGHVYRLPTAAEWEYAAKADGRQPPQVNHNCELRSGGKLVRGLSLVPVNSGDTKNSWGLSNYLGNAQEWVKRGEGLEARGGAYTDDIRNCEIDRHISHNGGPDDITGFRLVREI